MGSLHGSMACYSIKMAKLNSFSTNVKFNKYVMCILLVLWKIKFHMKSVDLFIIDSSIFKLDNMQQFFLQRQLLSEIIISRWPSKITPLSPPPPPHHHHHGYIYNSSVFLLTLITTASDNKCQHVNRYIKEYSRTSLTLQPFPNIRILALGPFSIHGRARSQPMTDEITYVASSPTGGYFTQLYSISQEICTRFCCALLCCVYAIVHNEISHCKTTTKHSKAKTVCIFLGIYCIYNTGYGHHVDSQR